MTSNMGLASIDTILDMVYGAALSAPVRRGRRDAERHTSGRNSAHDAAVAQRPDQKTRARYRRGAVRARRPRYQADRSRAGVSGEGARTPRARGAQRRAGPANGPGPERP